MNIKTCASCAHKQVRKSAFGLSVLVECAHPSAVHVVTGRPVRLCADMRAVGGACGPTALLHEREKPAAVDLDSVLPVLPYALTVNRSVTDMIRALIGMDVEVSR